MDAQRDKYIGRTAAIFWSAAFVGMLGGLSAAKLGVASEAGAAVAAKTLAGLSKAEVTVAQSVRGIYVSDAMATLRTAAANGTSAEIRVGGTLIQYEPGLPASAMTMFGENGFVLGPEAFASEYELAATLAHESYRLAMTRSAGGLSGELVGSETMDAFEFSKKVAGYIMGQ